MPREQKRKQINDTVYLVTQMDALRALKVQTKIISILGAGALGMASKALEAIKKGIKTEDIDSVIEILSPILNNFDDEVVNTLIVSLFDNGVMTEVISEGSAIPLPLDFNKDFTGKPMEMWQVVMFILEANFMPGE